MGLLLIVTCRLCSANNIVRRHRVFWVDQKPRRVVAVLDLVAHEA
jgi:hypothetical protein